MISQQTIDTVRDKNKIIKNGDLLGDYSERRKRIKYV
jgi:hypothetical protein